MEDLVYRVEPEEVRKTFLELYRDGKIMRCQDEMSVYAMWQKSTMVPSERAVILMRVLMKIWYVFDVMEQDFFVSSFEWRLLFCVNLLLKRFEEGIWYECGHTIFDEPEV